MEMNSLKHGLEDTPRQQLAPREKNFWALDWLRFVLAVYIVLFHTLNNKYAEIKGTWFEATLQLGNMATTVFFVLSGFLLTHAYVITKNGQELNRRKFLTARFSTLYPLHILGLLLALVPNIYAIYSQGGLTVPMDPSGTTTRMLGTPEVLLGLLSNILMLNAWNPYYLLINIPSWSLSALAFFYLAFPLFAPKVYRSKSPLLILLLAGILFALPGLIADLLQRNDLFTDGLLHRNPVIRLPLFVAGIALCVMFSRSQARGSRKQLIALGAVVVATVVVSTYLQFHEIRMHIIKNGVYLPAALALMWICACAKPISNGTVRYWGSRLGAASLPLFLLHVPLFSLYGKLEKLMLAVILSPAWNPSAIIATAREVEPPMALYPIPLILLVVACVVVQERFVLPVQARIRAGLARRTDKPAIVNDGISAG